MNLPVTTTFAIDGYRVREYKGADAQPAAASV